MFDGEEPQSYHRFSDGSAIEIRYVKEDDLKNNQLIISGIEEPRNTVKDNVTSGGKSLSRVIDSNFTIL